MVRNLSGAVAANHPRGTSDVEGPGSGLMDPVSSTFSWSPHALSPPRDVIGLIRPGKLSEVAVSEFSSLCRSVSRAT